MKILSLFIRGILFLFGAVGFSGFIVPFLKRRILNIGNLAGLIVCVGIILYAALMPQIHRLIRLFWQQRVGKVVLGILGTGLLIAVILAIVMSFLMIKAANTKPADNATVIILGCKVYGDRPSIMLAERMDAAITYLNDNPDSMCIVSGGQGVDETISEAECMYQYLTSNRIAPERIYKEDQSTSTRENLAFSYEIIKEHHLNDNIAIATNDFHEYRAGKIADSLNLEHGAVPGATALWLFPTYYARELFGILYEWVF